MRLTEVGKFDGIIFFLGQSAIKMKSGMAAIREIRIRIIRFGRGTQTDPGQRQSGSGTRDWIRLGGAGSRLMIIG